MLKAQKKLTRKQIKQDKFVTFYFKSQEFLTQHSKTILYAIGGVILVSLIIFVVKSKVAENEQNAMVELTKAKQRYFAADYEGVLPVLQNLIDTYSGSDGADEGLYYLANSYYFLKNYTEAQKYFEQFLDTGYSGILEASAIAGVAACHEEQGEYEDAARQYGQAAAQFGDSFMAPQYLFNSARCYALSGKSDDALKALTNLIEKYADSALKPDAEILLSELTS